LDTARFLSLSATDAWLTAAEIEALLEERGYWTGTQAHLPHRVRLAYVVRYVDTLRDATSRPLFERVTSLGPAGQPVVRYKQARLIQSPGDTSAPDPPAE
jgi:hypothetical protein